MCTVGVHSAGAGRHMVMNGSGGASHITCTFCICTFFTLQGPAATWAEREAAGCALLHLQLGWPLDLYAPCEFLQLYWWVLPYLCGVVIGQDCNWGRTAQIGDAQGVGRLPCCWMGS